MYQKGVKDGKAVDVPIGFMTPLYMAIRRVNYKSVDLILDHMSRIDFNSSRNIMSVFPTLVNYELLIKYMTNMPVQMSLMT